MGSVTTRTDVLAPLELWGAQDTQSTMGGCWVSNNMPRDTGRVPAVLNKFTNADAKFFNVFKLHGTESTGHDANKTLDLSVILMCTRNRSTLPTRDRGPMRDRRVERGHRRG